MKICKLVFQFFFQRVFEQRTQLMLRANSLKKAVRQIIEHTENGKIKGCQNAFY